MGYPVYTCLTFSPKGGAVLRRTGSFCEKGRPEILAPRAENQKSVVKEYGAGIVVRGVWIRYLEANI